MKTEYTIYRADGTEERSEVDWPLKPSLDQISSVVEAITGSPFEHVYVMVDNAIRDMFVDELGRVRKPPKPRNEAATRFYRSASIKQGAAPESLPHIVGDVILFDRRIWF